MPCGDRLFSVLIQVTTVAGNLEPLLLTLLES